MVKFLFRVYILTKVSYLLLLLFLVVHVLFRIYLHVWINCLLGLSNVSLLSTLKLRKNTGAIVHLPKSILCQLIAHYFVSTDVTFFESISYFSSQDSVIASEFVPLSPSVLLPTPSTVHDVSSLASLEDTTAPPAAKPVRNFRFVYSHQQKYSASESVPDDSSPVESPPPQLSAPPSDFDVPIALRKINWSCTYHPISHFVFYDHLILSFCQFALSLSSVSIPRSYEEATLVHV